MTVAIVHDYLNQPGGAERVALEMARIWPEAPIYTSIYRPDSTLRAFADRDVRTTFLDRLPVDTGFRALLPLYPAAFRSLGTLEEDLVVSSSSGFAHGVRTAEGSLHVVYCHSPARWLYGERYIDSWIGRMLFAPLRPPLRAWDRGAACRADGYISNAENVRRRVWRSYGIESDVVHPPVDTERFTPTPRGDRLLVVSRLLHYKRVDLVIRAATQLGMPLDVVGAGPALDDLRAIAGPSVIFHGRLDDEGVAALLEACNAVCFPGEEDFGIVPVEANAAGKPVVAFAAGGALETLEEGRTGVFFREQSVDAIVAAITRVGRLETSPTALAENASRFSVETFRRKLLRAIERIRNRQ